MLRFALAAAAVLAAAPACRYSLEDEEEPIGGGDGGRLCRTLAVPACDQAVGQQSLSWIEANIFDRNCGTGNCHGNVANPGGKIVLSTGSYARLVNVDSAFAPGRKLVVPGNVAQSYLMVLLRHVALGEADPAPAPAPPSDPGYMPPNNEPICCQKMDAIVRWIEAGAPNN